MDEFVLSKQPIIVDDEDVKDWENYKDQNGNGRNVLLFPPLESSQKGEILLYMP